METNLFFIKSETFFKNVLLSPKLLKILFIVMCFGTNLNAQISVVVPNANTIFSNGGTFLTVYASSARTYQLIIDDSQLTSLVGQNISSISFRIPTNSTSNWPATDATYSSYDVFLSNGVEPANRQLNFAANVVGTQTQVRSGPLVIPAGALTSGGSPTNAFSFKIEFTTPYLYTAGTNLVIQLSHSTNDINSSRSTEATGTSTAGYGTLFTACWQGTAGVVQANFSIVQINSGTLGVNSVEIDNTFAVYPNPVKDILQVKSDFEIVEYHIFNFAGQKIISEKNRDKFNKLDVTKLATGNYILQTIDKKGNSKSTKFIKEYQLCI